MSSQSSHVLLAAPKCLSTVTNQKGRHINTLHTLRHPAPPQSKQSMKVGEVQVQGIIRNGVYQSFGKKKRWLKFWRGRRLQLELESKSTCNLCSCAHYGETGPKRVPWSWPLKKQQENNPQGVLWCLCLFQIAQYSNYVYPNIKLIS